MGQTLRILEVWGSARHGLRVLPLAMLLALPVLVFKLADGQF